eukprot:2839061-Ditylum_brightwellii.AAC.1
MRVQPSSRQIDKVSTALCCCQLGTTGLPSSWRAHQYRDLPFSAIDGTVGSPPVECLFVGQKLTMHGFCKVSTIMSIIRHVGGK